MKFLSRVLGPGPRKPGRARPAAASRATTRGGTPKRPNRVHCGKRRPWREALDRITRSLTRNNRSVDGKKLVAVYHHGTCTVNHRSRKAASRCRRTS
jgi:hypothetical protein